MVITGTQAEQDVYLGAYKLTMSRDGSQSAIR